MAGRTKKMPIEAKTCAIWGRFAHRRGEKRKPPDHLSDREARFWEQGWDAEEANQLGVPDAP